jgi:cytidylate kinase
MTTMKGERKITIAIDGFSSTGKSTMAKVLASRIGYAYVDTGAMYRAVTLYCLEHNLIDAEGNVDHERLIASLDDIHIGFAPVDGANHTLLDGRDVESEIRGMEVSERVSTIATIGEVRRHLVSQQQAMGRDGGVVMDGRDIGTVVFPHAQLKVFVTASAEVRAQRRYDELQQKGMPADYADILKNVQERDYIDSHREVSPLRQADDALLLDNSHMTIPEQNEWLMQRFEEASR